MKFITSQGSEYTFFKDSQESMRLKKSGGSGQGEMFDKSKVVFIKDKARVYHPKVRVEIRLFNKNGTLFPLPEDQNGRRTIPKVISEDNKLVVVELDKDNLNNVLHIQRAFLYPDIGLYPFEYQTLENNKTYKHLGNKIIEILE
tara:strand:+ start:195 stop:626 length:432 start_codon:yes stop_codon:yes gene_type:complete